MNRKLYLPLLMAFALVFVGCKKMGPLSPDYFQTTPQVLEAVGGKVPVTINGKFPEKYFNKKAIVTVTPVLVYANGETEAAPFTYQGEKVKGNNQAINYRMGGNITMTTSFPYKPEMKVSELYLRPTVTVGKKSYQLPQIKIADGVIATAELANGKNAGGSYAADKFQRIISDQMQANIMFLINQSILRPSEVKSQSLADFNKSVKELEQEKSDKGYTQIKALEISSYASPDGALDFNTKLAEAREKVTEGFWSKEVQKMGLDKNINSNFTPEDWDGFRELVSKSNIQDKEMILRVLSMYSDPAQREAEIKNMSTVFKVLAEEILPQLRRSKLIAAYEVIGKTDEVIANLAKTSPKDLNVEELLYAATLVKTSNRAQYLKEVGSIYKSVTETYPSCYRGFNNLGTVYFAEGNYSAAADAVKKAASLNANSPEVNMNLGLLELVNGNTTAAQTYFGKAGGAKDAGEALGTLYMMQGDFNKAVNAYGSIKSNNAAVAQIVTRDYNKASSTLDAIAQPSGLTYYLKAVVAARTNKEADVLSNLKEAVALDSSLAKEAATDIEFAKYFGNSSFTAIAK